MIPAFELRALNVTNITELGAGAAPYNWFGWVGVEVFFVISGFVIANSATTSSPKEFLLGRALRLYPAIWVGATATLIH